MQTNIHPDLIGREDVAEADKILRTCVHCGFCTAVCPTYQLLGDELDGPRGRIYLIKNMLEDNDVSNQQVTHIDRCLTCRACETACPSAVEYGRLLDIGREIITEKTGRPLRFRIMARLLRLVVPWRRRFGFLLALGRVFRPVLPAALACRIPPRDAAGPVVGRQEGAPVMRVLLLRGCVQAVATPGVNGALARLLARRNIAVEELDDEGCCGALDYHLSAHEEGLDKMRALIDRLHSRLGHVDAIVSTASGCGVTIKEYPRVLQHDPDSREKAQAVAGKVRDVSELLTGMQFDCQPIRAAFQVPCSLQHGQRITGTVESILRDSNIELTEVKEGHLCCGSAGTYSLMQPALARQLLHRKLDNLMAGAPEVIVTANVGCQLHLQSATDLPVIHWVQLLDRQLGC